MEKWERNTMIMGLVSRDEMIKEKYKETMTTDCVTRMKRKWYVMSHATDNMLTYETFWHKFYQSKWYYTKTNKYEFLLNWFNYSHGFLEDFYACNHKWFRVKYSYWKN